MAVAMRVYDLALSWSTVAWADLGFRAAASGLKSDVIAWFALFLLASLPAFLIARKSVRAAQTFVRVVLALAAVAAVLLSQYFATSTVLLGADVWGYSPGEIVSTVGASGGVSVGQVAALIIAPAFAWVVTSNRVVGRVALASREARIVFALALLTVVRMVPTAQPEAGESETVFGWRQSKLGYFATSTLHMIGGGAPSMSNFSGYPLWRAFKYDDVLAPHLKKAPTAPNIVVVVVEGLGRDFTGHAASYGGFTPFLDSLADKNIAFDNFVATQGRTFGVMPSLLGSLPPVIGSFAELDPMPDHESLVSVLRDRGYATHYFTGTDGRFDGIDAFLDAQGVDRFVDQASFPPSYVKEPAAASGFSWGYADADLFRRSFDVLGDSRGPRLDVYLTVTLHEPFIPPDSAKWRSAFDARLASMPLKDDIRARYRAHPEVFFTLLYVDDALRQLFAAYAKRPEYSRTLFVITGDHRLIPVPFDNSLSRFHVPLIIASPLVKAPLRVGPMSSHLDVTPSLLAHLKRTYGLPIPDSAHWMGTGFDMTGESTRRTIPIMRTKTEFGTLVWGADLLDQGRHFAIVGNMDVSNDPYGIGPRDLQRMRDSISALSKYVVRKNMLMPVASPDKRIARAREDSALQAAHLGKAIPDSQYAFARARAFEKDYVTARLIARRILRTHPNHHDARTLLGRTYAWDQQFDSARAILGEVLKRDPNNDDARSALVDVDLWSGSGASALARIDSALKKSPRDAELLARRKRAQDLIAGRK